jgi:3-oxoadipate enol-lactonase
MTALHFLDPNPTGYPAVLFLHGLGADGTSWSLQLPELASAGFRPLAPDIPGFGKSAYDGSGWSICRVAGQMADFLKELGAAPAHVVGLSLGGVIAQQFALDFPELTLKLVLASTFSFLRPDNWSGWIYYMKRLVLVSTRGLPAQAKIVAERIFPQAQYEPLRDMLVAAISRADPRVYRRAMFSLGIFDSRKRLEELKNPTLILTGAEDTTVLPARQRRLAEAIPGSIHRVIAHAGHAIPLEQAEKFNRSLINFLKNKTLPLD